MSHHANKLQVMVAVLSQKYFDRVFRYYLSQI